MGQGHEGRGHVPEMPPWFADPKYGHFSNDRAFSQTDIDTIVAWVDGGAKEGDAKEAPQAVAWPADGWLIQPDYIVKGPSYDVPAKGVLEWTNVVVPSGLTKDTWISLSRSSQCHSGDASHLRELHRTQARRSVWRARLGGQAARRDRQRITPRQGREESIARSAGSG